MPYIAHIRERDKQEQSLAEHLINVCKLAENYGLKLQVSHIAGLAGLLHDLGKYSTGFQKYIRDVVYSPGTAPAKGSIDHSTAGGKWLFDLLHAMSVKGSVIQSLLAEIVGNAIISHHAYLHDFLNLQLESDYLRRVMHKKDIAEYNQLPERFFAEVMTEEEFLAYIDKALAELENYMMVNEKVSAEHKGMLLSKFIFSTLIDADRTDSRQFEENVKEQLDDRSRLFCDYHERLLGKIEGFRSAPEADSPINRLRQQMSEQCETFADRPSGIYTLSIPTGGGKTLASLRYALKHAQRFGKKRIVYVVPYTTIIEQNVAEVRNLFQDPGNILEHHSNVAEQEDEEGNEWEEAALGIKQKLRLAKDNWDSPIIFTTMVQFLNAFYAGGTRSIRRLHNLGEAVIIFDEVQKVPISCVTLFNYAVNFIKRRANSSILLCTATQPELGFVRHRLDLEADAEIVPDLNGVAEAFRRVKMVDGTRDGAMNTVKLANLTLEKAEEAGSVLIILNTRTVVRKLYQALLKSKVDIPVYHLSTSMCPAHRKAILSDVKQRLRQKQPVICVSTALIEAGVDISFRCVIRSLAGLDSIAQAAGRCNRHGEEAQRPVYMIEHAEENLSRLREVRIGRSITRNMLRDLDRDPSLYGGNLLSAAAMERYFREFYTEFGSDLDYRVRALGRNMTELLTSAENQRMFRHKHGTRPSLALSGSYGTAAKFFEVIEDKTFSVLVPYEEGEKLIRQLEEEHTIAELSRLLREAQAYTINIREYEKERLEGKKWLMSRMEGKVLVLKSDAYNEEYGLDLGER